MTKDTKGKAKLRYIPYSALVAIAEVREYGIKKYNGDNYHGVDPEDFVEAAARHIHKWMDGTDLDDESGLDHLHHAITSLALAIENRKVERYVDRHLSIDAMEDELNDTTLRALDEAKKGLTKETTLKELCKLADDFPEGNTENF
tara:strand:- start:3400 stop:3834 length:435 start_codon:yes stop_codon:yes gene_type:complete